MYGAVFGTDHAPAAFSLHAAQGRDHAWSQPAQSGAVGYLVKSVFSGDRAHFYRFEQYIVSRISAHNHVFLANQAVVFTVYVG